MDQQSLVEPRPAGRNVYAFDAQMLIMAAIATVFLFVVFLVGLHLYARWWLRRGASARRTHVFVLADNHHPASADRGLDPSVLSSLPVFTFSSKAAPAEEEERERPLLECAVCLSEFEESEIGRLLPKCHHSFHIECIDMWFHSHSTCPLCRSPVESPSDRSEPSPVVVVEVVEGSSSGSGLCDTCEHEEGSESVGATSLARRRKAVGVKIEVAQPRIENELTQGSPMTRMLSFKRLLSMGGMSPSGSRASPRYRAGTSRAAAAELDLEGGLGEPVRVYTPK